MKTKLLIVDDEPDAVNSLKRFFSVRDFEISSASSGGEALDILKSQEVDRVLLDIVMPGMNGNEVAEIIKYKYPSVKIFIVTAYPQEGAKMIQKNGIKGLLLKPCTILDIYTQITDIKTFK